MIVYVSKADHCILSSTFYHSEPSFHVVASVLRASTTLSFTQFRTWAVKWLESTWSNDLDDLGHEVLPNAAETVVLCRKYNVPNALKRALYELVVTPTFDQDTAGETESDGSHPETESDGSHPETESDGSHPETASDGSHPDLVAEPKTCSGVLALSQDDLQGLNTAKTAFVSAFLDMTVTSPASYKCVKKLSPCKSRSMSTWARLVFKTNIVKDYHTDPLSGLLDLREKASNWEKEGWCIECIESRREAWQEKREELWSKLDEWFGL
jgi:hypothetical protein